MPLFWRTFCLSLVGTLVLIGAIGFAVSRSLVRPPPERLMTDLFEMNLVKGWSCQMEGTEWVCQPPGQEPYDATAIIAMKYRGPGDTMKAYLDHLRKPKPVTWRGGSSMSEVENTGIRRIGAYDWAEGIHFESELEGYRTHYLGTFTSYAAMLVSFSAHKSFYASRKAEFERMIGSLVVYQRAPGNHGRGLMSEAR